jgi:hypothetical protein
MPSWLGTSASSAESSSLPRGLNSHSRGFPVFKILTLRCYLRMPGFQRPTMGITAPPSEHTPLRRRCFWGPKKMRPQRGGELRPNLKACQEGQHPTQFWISVCLPPPPINSALLVAALPVIWRCAGHLYMRATRSRFWLPRYCGGWSILTGDRTFSLYPSC